MSSCPQPRTSAWPHRLALAVALTTFPLIWVGGLVTTYEAGMAVPDWPTTYGYNLFRYPWQTWLFGPWDLFIEHGHRLLGATVGLLTIAMLIAFWRAEARPLVRWLSVVALCGVIAQGLLGGMRVLFDERDLARIHGCLGPAFFAFVAALVVVTSKAWQSNQPAFEAVDSRQAGKTQRLALLTALFAYLQIVVGSFLRHQSLTAGPGTFRAVVLFHLVLAAAVFVHAILLCAAVYRLPARIAPLRRSSAVLTTLVGLQVVLGTLTWLENYGSPMGGESVGWVAAHTVRAQSQWQSLVTTAHVATGSLILAFAVVAALNSFRWLATTRDHGADRHARSMPERAISNTFMQASLAGSAL